MTIGRGPFGHIRTHGSIGGTLVPWERLEPEDHYKRKNDRTWRKSEGRRHGKQGKREEDA